MGNHESSHKSKHREYDDAARSFDSQELAKWKACFDEMCQGTPTKKKHAGFNEEQFSAYTKSIFPPQLQKNFLSAFALTGSVVSVSHQHGHHDSNIFVEWESFIIGLSHLLKSGLDEKARMLTLLCGSTDGTVTKSQLTETLASLFQAYISAESKSAEFQTWKFATLALSGESNISLASYLLSDLVFNDQDSVSLDVLTRWIGSHSVLARVIDLVVYVAFHFEVQRDPEEIGYIPWTIPSCREIDWTKVDTLFTVPTLLLLNYHLPSEYRHEWKLLYATSMYGESFSTLLKQITMKGPTVMIIKDENDHVFGGFNSKNWELSSNFLGDDSCFVFTLFPTIAFYGATGRNKNYCYLNTHQQTLPNGLGFGGTVAVDDQPVHYFALWLDHDFGKGKSQGASTTYNNPRLSSTPDFMVRSIEVWGVERQEDAVKKAKMAKSILDIDPQAQAILEMVGKTRQSEGLRELPPPDE